jgi:transcriptional regulator NrdR family protein
VQTDPTPKDVKADDEVGIRCRQCGCGHFFTLETRKMIGQRIMRRRECRHCGKRITTYERAFG